MIAPDVNLEIRKWEPADAPAIARVFAAERVFANTLQLPYPSVASWTERLAKFGNDDYMLVGLVNQAVVATAALHLSAGRRRAHAATLGMCVGDDVQGKGIGGAMLVALLEAADGWLNVLRIELTVFHDNAPALALYRKYGFEPEGRHRAFAFRNGVYVDALCMARLHPKQLRALGYDPQGESA